jgi:hypothetical protein
MKQKLTHDIGSASLFVHDSRGCVNCMVVLKRMCIRDLCNSSSQLSRKYSLNQRSRCLRGLYTENTTYTKTVAAKKRSQGEVKSVLSPLSSR